jgi:acyl carrier protein
MAEKFTKEQIYDELKRILVEALEINENLIKKDANLFEDLELDSIDAVDIAVHMQRFTDKKLAPEDFKQIKTVNDVVEAVYNLLQKND